MRWAVNLKLVYDADRKQFVGTHGDRFTAMPILRGEKALTDEDKKAFKPAEVSACIQKLDADFKRLP